MLKAKREPKFKVRNVIDVLYAAGLVATCGSLICAGYVSGCWHVQGGSQALEKPVGDELVN